MATRVDGVTVDPNAIPWLLLKATKTTAGRGGNLIFGAQDVNARVYRSAAPTDPVSRWR